MQVKRLKEKFIASSNFNAHLVLVGEIISIYTVSTIKSSAAAVLRSADRAIKRRLK